MFVKVEINDFNSLKYNCWCGALDTLNAIEERGMEDEFMNYLEDIFCDEIPTMTELNDFIWFEDETIFGDLGIEIEEEDDEDEEEEEDK